MENNPSNPSDGTPMPDASRATRQLVTFVVLSAVFLGIGLLGPAMDWFSTGRIHEVSRSLGWWGPLLIVVLGTVSPLLLLPRWPIAVVCGLLYGVVWGTALATLASTLGAWLHFHLARTLLSATSERILHRYKWDRLRVPPDKVFMILFLLRAFPLSNFVATNILAGSLKVPVRIYLAASFLGMIPSTVMYAAWGKAARHPSAGFTVLIAVTLTFIVVGTILARRYFLPWFRRATGRDDGQIR